MVEMMVGKVDGMCEETFGRISALGWYCI